MAPSRVLRALLFVGIWLTTLAVARPAHAAWAPLCDDRGASAMAPPPLLNPPEDVLSRARGVDRDRDAFVLLAALGGPRGELGPSHGDYGSLMPPSAARALEACAFVPPVRRPRGQRPRHAVRSRVERPPRV